MNCACVSVDNGTIIESCGDHRNWMHAVTIRETAMWQRSVAEIGEKLRTAQDDVVTLHAENARLAKRQETMMLMLRIYGIDDRDIDRRMP